MAATYLHKLRRFSPNVRIYMIATGLMGFHWYGVGAVLFNLYLLRRGYGPEFIGLASALSSITFSVATLPVGALSTRWGTRPFMITGMGLLTASTALALGSELLPVRWQAAGLLARYPIMGLSLAFWFVCSIPFLTGATAPEERQHVFSFRMALGPLVGFVGSLVGGALPGVLAAVFSLSLQGPAPYRYSLLLSVAVLAAATVTLGTTRDVHREPKRRAQVPRGRLPYGLMAVFGIGYMLRNAGYSASTDFLNVYLDTGLHIPTAVIGALTSAARIVAVPAALITPGLVAHLGRKRMIVLATLGQALGLLMLGLVPNFAAAGIASVAMFAMFAMSVPIIQVYSQELVEPGWRVVMSAVLMLGAGTVSGIMSLGGGYAIVHLGYNALFTIGAVLTLAGVLLFLVHFRVHRGEQAPPSESLPLDGACPEAAEGARPELDEGAG